MTPPNNTNRAETYKRKLLQAFESTNNYPIDLEWMVEIFKYKHISSLTTHLKRHFRERKEYLKKAEGSSKKAWRYYITIECFKRICYFCRHSERKVVAKYWLRRLAACGQKYGNTKRKEKANPGCTRTSTCEVTPPRSPQQQISQQDSDEDTEEYVSEDEYCSSSNSKSGSDTDYSEAEQDEYTPVESTSVRDKPINKPTISSHNKQQTTTNNNIHHYQLCSNTIALPQVLHPFNFFFHDWSYLKLSPMNHYLLSFYYTLHPGYYIAAPNTAKDINTATNNASTILNNTANPIPIPNSTSNNSLQQASAHNINEEGEFTDPLDLSFDTNAFLSFPNELCT